MRRPARSVEVGAERVSPGNDSVGLVDGHQSEATTRCGRAEGSCKGGHQTLRVREDDLLTSRSNTVYEPRLLIGRQAAVIGSWRSLWVLARVSTLLVEGKRNRWDDHYGNGTPHRAGDRRCEQSERLPPTRRQVDDESGPRAGEERAPHSSPLTRRAVVREVVPNEFAKNGSPRTDSSRLTT